MQAHTSEHTWSISGSLQPTGRPNATILAPENANIITGTAHSPSVGLQDLPYPARCRKSSYGGAVDQQTLQQHTVGNQGSRRQYPLGIAAGQRADLGRVAHSPQGSRGGHRSHAPGQIPVPAFAPPGCNAADDAKPSQRGGSMSAGAAPL